jgi:hypothetical protein
MNSKAALPHPSLLLDLEKIPPISNPLISPSFSKNMKSIMILFKKGRKSESSKTHSNPTHQRLHSKHCHSNNSISLQINKTQHRNYTNGAIIASCFYFAPFWGGKAVTCKSTKFPKLVEH